MGKMFVISSACESKPNRDNQKRKGDIACWTAGVTSMSLWCLDDFATPQLDTVTLRPAPSGTVKIRPKNIFILRQSDPTTPKLLSLTP